MFDLLGGLYDDNDWRTNVNNLRTLYQDFERNGVRPILPMGLGSQPLPQFATTGPLPTTPGGPPPLLDLPDVEADGRAGQSVEPPPVDGGGQTAPDAPPPPPPVDGSAQTVPSDAPPAAR